jgi:hypothetical protein
VDTLPGISIIFKSTLVSDDVGAVLTTPSTVAQLWSLRKNVVLSGTPPALIILTVVLINIILSPIVLFIYLFL